MIAGDCLCVFQVPGNPLPHKSNRTHPSTQHDLEQKTFAKKIMDTYPYQPMSCPLFLQIYFYMPISSTPKKRSRPGDLHTLLPDLSNCIKFVMGAMNGIVWKDEKFICGIQACKIFDENPHTIIRVLDAKTVKLRSTA